MSEELKPNPSALNIDNTDRGIEVAQAEYVIELVWMSVHAGREGTSSESDRTPNEPWTRFLAEMWANGDRIVLRSWDDLSDDARAKYAEIKASMSNKQEETPEKSERGKRIAATRVAADKAAEMGAIMSIDRRLTAFSTEELQDSFTPNAIMRLALSRDIDIDTVFDDDGMLIANDIDDKDIKKIDEVQAAFLGSVAAMVERIVEEDDTTKEITFSVPKIIDELSIDPRKYSKKRTEATDLATLRHQKIKSLILPFDRCVGMLPNGSFWRVLMWGGYEPESQTVTIFAPYIFQLARLAQMQDSAWRHRYLHASVVNEPNLAAVEVANRIICGLARRGTRTDYANGLKTSDNTSDRTLVSYTVPFQTIVDSCPTLSMKLDAIEHPTDSEGNPVERKKSWNAAYNAKLRQVFEAAFRIIETKSDVPKVYKDFKLPKMMKTVRGVKVEGYNVPTRSTLRTKLVITHHGFVSK